MAYIKEIKNKNIEEIYESPRLDLKIFRKKSSAKTPSGLVLSHAKKFRKIGNIEMAQYMQELYKQIFNLETSEKIVFQSWKGKSGLKIFNKPDRIIVIWYKKTEKDSEPKEIKNEILKEEINKVILSINKLNENENIESSDIAVETYKRNWKSIFSDRKTHITFTHILNVLEYYGMIKYFRSGKVRVLKNVREIQEVLG